jgi:hypothetical protein
MEIPPWEGVSCLVECRRVLLKVPISEAQEDVRFSFDIAFDERVVKAGTTVFILLRMMADQVFEVVRSMGPHLQ